MSLDPISLCAVGMIIVLAGGGLFLRALLASKKESWWPPVVAGALLTGLGGGLALYRFDTWLVLSSFALGLAGLTMGLFRSTVPSWLAQLLSRPILQASIVLVGGVAITILGVCWIDRDMRREANEAEDMMAGLLGAVAPDTDSTIICRTDLGRTINLHPHKAVENESFKPTTEAEFIRKMKLEVHLIQTGPSEAECNCHGWIFAAGRYWLLGRWIETILMDNGYREVLAPKPGDVAIFRDAKGDIAHSALVRGRGTDGMILLESKWGQLGRYVHTTNQHAYKGNTIRYYRTARGSHTLAGLEGSKPDIVATEEE